MKRGDLQGAGRGLVVEVLVVATLAGVGAALALLVSMFT